MGTSRLRETPFWTDVPGKIGHDPAHDLGLLRSICLWVFRSSTDCPSPPAGAPPRRFHRGRRPTARVRPAMQTAFGDCEVLCDPGSGGLAFAGDGVTSR